MYIYIYTYIASFVLGISFLLEVGGYIWGRNWFEDRRLYEVVNMPPMISTSFLYYFLYQKVLTSLIFRKYRTESNYIGLHSRL